MCTLQWRHNRHDGVLNHQPHHSLLNRLFRPRSYKASKLRVTGLYEGNSPGTGEFPPQMASNAEEVSIWWRHHEARLINKVARSLIHHIENRFRITGPLWGKSICHRWISPDKKASNMGFDVFELPKQFIKQTIGLHYFRRFDIRTKLPWLIKLFWLIFGCWISRRHSLNQWFRSTDIGTDVLFAGNIDKAWGNYRTIKHCMFHHKQKVSTGGLPCLGSSYPERIFMSGSHHVFASELKWATVTGQAWWRHQWIHFPRYWSFVRGIHRSPLNSPHKGQWRGALMFSLICVWINGWVNNREAGDLKRYHAHYDVIVMADLLPKIFSL